MPLFEYKCPNGHELLIFAGTTPQERIGCPIKECVVGANSNDIFKHTSGQTMSEQTMATLIGQYKG